MNVTFSDKSLWPYYFGNRSFEKTAETEVGVSLQIFEELFKVSGTSRSMAPKYRNGKMEKMLGLHSNENRELEKGLEAETSVEGLKMLQLTSTWGLHSCFPLSSPVCESRLHRDFFSLLFSLWTVLRLKPSSAKQRISQMHLAKTFRA